MSKYSVDVSRRNRKSEIAGENMSFSQEQSIHESGVAQQQYSFARANISATQTDTTKKPLRIEKDILDQLNESPRKEDALTPKEGNAEFIINATAVPASTSASQKIFGFFQNATSKVTSRSSEISQKLINALTKKRNDAVPTEDQIPLNPLEDEGLPVNQLAVLSSVNLEAFNNSSLVRKPEKSNKQPSSLANAHSIAQIPQQDFGNISEIQELKQNQFQINDDTAQEEEDFKSLLANNHINPHNDHSIDVNDPAEITKTEGGIDDSKPNQHTPTTKNSRNSLKLKQINEETMRSARYASEAGQSDRKLTDRGRKEVKETNNNLSQQPQKLTPHQHQLIEEAKRKKKLLEDQLKAVSNEINHLIIEGEKDKPQGDQDERNHSKGSIYAKRMKSISESSPHKPQQIVDDQDAKERAFDLVRRMNKARQEKQQRAAKESRAFAEQVSASAYEAISEKVRVKAELAANNYESINQRVDKIKQRKIQRVQANQQSNQLIREIQQGVELTDPKERYFREVELPELERRKHELAQKRKMYRPITIEEIREHALKHDDEMRMRKLQAKSNIMAIDYAEELETLPKSNIMREVMEKDKQVKMKNVMEQQKIKEQIERRREYARLVKEVHKPKVKLRINAGEFNELEEVDENVNEFFGEYDDDQQSQSASVQRYQPPPIVNGRLKRKGNESVKSLSRREEGSYRSSPRLIFGSDSVNGGIKQQQPQQNRYVRGGRDQEGEMNNYEGSASTLSKVNRNPAFSGITGMSQDQLEAAKAKRRQVETQGTEANENLLYNQKKKFEKNYIQESRQNRIEQEKKGKVSKIDDWEKYKYDPSLSQKEKYAHILQSAARLEHNARIKELNSGGKLDQQEAVNNLYINSIKAKLSLLDNFS